MPSLEAGMVMQRVAPAVDVSYWLVGTSVVNRQVTTAPVHAAIVLLLYLILSRIVVLRRCSATPECRVRLGARLLCQRLDENA